MAYHGVESHQKVSYDHLLSSLIFHGVSSSIYSYFVGLWSMERRLKWQVKSTYPLTSAGNKPPEVNSIQVRPSCDDAPP